MKKIFLFSLLISSALFASERDRGNSSQQVPVGSGLWHDVTHMHEKDQPGKEAKDTRPAKDENGKEIRYWEPVHHNTGM